MSSRREFLKTTAAAVPAAAVTGSLAIDEVMATDVAATPVDPSQPPPADVPQPYPPVPTPGCTPEKLKVRGQIAAKVDQRLLTKAERLFSGSKEGRITEMLQNSRRAGAKTVWIECRQSKVTYVDDGHGLSDFGQLLAMGFSGWSDDVEAAEDPAGSGFFSLAPRTTTVSSRGKQVTIDRSGWLGAPVDVVDCDWHGQGIRLEFEDAWEWGDVEPEAKYGPLTVYFNGRKIPHEDFLEPREGSKIVHLPHLGCRVQFPSVDRFLSRGRDSTYSGARYVNINFHGQTLASKFPVPDVQQYRSLTIGVDMTGEPTELRMVLPAREKLVENDAARQLKRELTRLLLEDARDSYAKLGHPHCLPYRFYLEAQKLGIDIGESAFSVETRVGQYHDENGHMTFSFEHQSPTPQNALLLDGGIDDSCEGRSLDLLAEFGRNRKRPFKWVPCCVTAGFDAYHWAQKLPRVTEIEVTYDTIVPPGASADNSRSARFSCHNGSIILAKNIMVGISINECDMMWFETPIAVDTDGDVVMTPKMLQDIDNDQLFVLLGGYDDDEDWDTQWNRFENDVNEALIRLRGPYESSRQDAFNQAKHVATKLKVADKPWQKIQVNADGSIEVLDGNGVVLGKVDPAPDFDELYGDDEEEAAEEAEE